MQFHTVAFNSTEFRLTALLGFNFTQFYSIHSVPFNSTQLSFNLLNFRQFCPLLFNHTQRYTVHLKSADFDSTPSNCIQFHSVTSESFHLFFFEQNSNTSDLRRIVTLSANARKHYSTKHHQPLVYSLFCQFATFCGQAGTSYTVSKPLKHGHFHEKREKREWILNSQLSANS